MMNVTGPVYTLSPDGQLQSYIFLRAIAPELESLTERLNELIRSGEKEYKSREVLLELINHVQAFPISERRNNRGNPNTSI